MPRLTAEERLMRLVPLDVAALRADPAEAIQRAGLSPERIRIGMLGDRPVYRVLGQGTGRRSTPIQVSRFPA
jgi:hypothetical protein